MRRVQQPLFSAVVCLVFLLIPIAGYAQTEQPLDEITLGLTQRTRILAAHPKIEGTTANLLAETVFMTLLRTPTGASAPFLPYEVTLIQDSSVNAFSTAAGKVYLSGGILPLMRDDLGVWAAVLSHEIAHTLRQHHYRAYLRAFQLQYQIAYYRARAAQGDESANWALLGLAIVGPLANLKLSRNEEHDADRLGVMMMAEAGYHPDWAITLQRRMRKNVGDQSKLGAFFSDHPRWATREQRTMKAYADALDVFQSRWADLAQSPGGTPPPIATLGAPLAREDQINKSAVIVIPLEIRNAKDVPITVAVFFSKDNRPVAGALAEYQSKDGSLAAFEVLKPHTYSEPATVAIAVPTAALRTTHRKLKAVVVVAAGDEILETSKPFKVSFPKPAKH